MSLLPRDTISIPGVMVPATCAPAREVGGDYYEFVRLADRRLGILVADVSGKGTSAAFYMAELKGLFLSLSRIYESPKQLLVEVNLIIADHIDSRSFITMTYAVLDMDRETLTYARGDHTPLIYMHGEGGRATADMLTPSGLVVGLDGFESHFEHLIEEASLRVAGGDTAVFFSDEVSEAMNEADDLFGANRLRRLVEENPDLSAEALCDRILSELDLFVGSPVNTTT
jgi:sigma-B regulation protein RsbU (phosphoserine phosphatase)